MRVKAGCMGFVAAAAMLFAGPALAQDARFYVGASVGQAEVEGFCSEISSIVSLVGGSLGSCDEKDTAWKLFGGYQFNRHFALEGSYFDYGSASARGQTFGVPLQVAADLTAFGIAAVGMLPLGSQFSLFGKLGLLRSELDVGASGVGGASAGSDSETGLHYGVGLMFNLAGNFSVRAEWERNDEAEIDMLSLGVQVRF